jgi:hypothetical protein
LHWCVFNRFSRFKLVKLGLEVVHSMLEVVVLFGLVVIFMGSWGYLLLA